MKIYVIDEKEKKKIEKALKWEQLYTLMGLWAAFIVGIGLLFHAGSLNPNKSNYDELYLVTMVMIVYNIYFMWKQKRKYSKKLWVQKTQYKNGLVTLFLSNVTNEQSPSKEEEILWITSREIKLKKTVGSCFHLIIEKENKAIVSERMARFLENDCK